MMESFAKLQLENKKLIEKAKVNFKKSPKERLTQIYVATRLESLEDRWQDFIRIHKKIIEVATEEDLKKTYFTNDVYDQTEEIYLLYKTELKEYVHGSIPVSNDGKKVTCNDKNNVKLPKISLPIFSGQYSEWTSFRDLFLSLIDKNEALDDVQKLHYLKGHLSGEAEQLLRHTPVTASNYAECWATLNKRYDNKRFLCNNMLKRFINQPVIVKESSVAIKKLLDNTLDCLQGLRTLKIDVSSWDVIVIFIVGSKLDFESRKLWESQISVGDKLPTFDEFQLFLESRFRALEYLDSKLDKPVTRNNVKTFHIASEPCILCSGDHKLCHCKEFAKKDTDSRREFARVNKLCFNCLAKNHTVYSCRQATKCHLCKKRHHTLLHPKSVNTAATVNVPTETNTVVAAAIASSNPSEHTTSVCCYADVHNHGLLATALINVESKTGSAIVLRALMDQGSQVSFITESAVQLLGLKKTSAHTDITRLGDDEGTEMPSRWIVKFKIQSRLDPTFVLPVSAYVLKRLTSYLPQTKIVQDLSSLSSLDLADPTFHTPGKIDILLSTRVVGEILQEGLVKGPPGTPVAQKTKLGWILSGEVSKPITKPVCCSVVARTDVNELLRKFWELESDESSSRQVILTEEEQKCEDLYSSSTVRDATGRYVVKLPFKSVDPQCQYGRSEDVARKRFHMLERKFIKNPELGMQYKSVIREYLQLGHAEVVPQSEIEKTAVYLPHHAVVREDKSTTKVRVVFDASCSGCNGVSLNDDLMVGPTLQPDLRHTIMRWRCHPICLIADIVKMYRQVKVCEEHIDYQRILWRENPDTELQHLRLLRVTFGTSSAPYLAVRTLQQLAHDEGKEFPLVAERVLKDYYVDDFLSGCESVTEGEQIYSEMNELLGRGGFQLQKWSSNSDELLSKIQPSQLKDDQFINFEPETSVKILGLTWNRNTDEFQYTVHLPPLETPVTKRKVISDIARLFDPLGWISPVIITAKVFIQRLWLSGITWDEELPKHLLHDWLAYRSTLHNLQNFRLPRWIHTSRHDSGLELQGFCDASSSAYSAVVYTRSIDSNGYVHVNLVASKTKVAPIKQVSIPRLELCGAVLLSKLLSEVSDTLGIARDNVHAWTDSSVVLAWLSSHPSRWKTFIGNRVSEILRVMSNNQWSHVQSKDNPADCASRGVAPCDLEKLILWVSGPSWLKHEVIAYSKDVSIDTNLEERRSNIVANVVTEQEEKDEFISRFSTLRKLIRVTAYCRRFLKLKNKPKFTCNLTFSEMNEALLTCIRKCQSVYFESEIDNLKKTGKIDKKGKITSLCPYLDRDNILRVGGRLQQANLQQDMKHPIIIPHKSHLTILLVSDAHERTLHGGPQMVLNYLRSRYWIVNAKSVVRQYIHRCVTCMRYSARSNQPLMGQLPASRVNATRPFRQSGVDYAGPISIRPTKGRGYRSTKGYICLFICMATRAIHLEVVSDMTSQAFISAFKRFAARRGHCDDLWSDNGTTFVGANKELKNLFRLERSGVASDIADWLAINGTNWHFIPPHSPNFGGLWEAGIKSTKHHLKRIIGTSTLTFEEMTTVLAQIEACLNSRPLSAISCSPKDPCPLTPGHFLVGEPLLLVPEANFENSNISSLNRWHLTQRLVQDFWRRWSREYLVQFHHRHKWSRNSIEPNVGDVVLVMEDDLPPARWLHGLIVDKHAGLDNVTRVVSLRCKGSIIKRPVSKLIVLPIAN